MPPADPSTCTQSPSAVRGSFRAAAEPPDASPQPPPTARQLQCGPLNTRGAGSHESAAADDDSLCDGKQDYIRCDSCGTWREVTAAYLASIDTNLPWFCDMHPVPALSYCPPPGCSSHSSFDKAPYKDTFLSQCNGYLSPGQVGPIPENVELFAEVFRKVARALKYSSVPALLRKIWEAGSPVRTVLAAT